MEELGGCSVHGPKSDCDVYYKTESEAFDKLKQLLYLLPNNYLDNAHNNNQETAQTFDMLFEASQNTPDLSSIASSNINKAYDMSQVISQICDAHTFFEIQETFAPNIITGFAKLDNKTIGIVANQPLIKAGTIDIDAW